MATTDFGPFVTLFGQHGADCCIYPEAQVCTGDQPARHNRQQLDTQGHQCRPGDGWTLNHLGLRTRRFRMTCSRSSHR
jgi:hypothetical protein